MGWAVGWDFEHRRWLGYGVPAICEHPDCDESIDRGIYYRCGGMEDEGCDQFFCGSHLYYVEGFEESVCQRCGNGEDPFPIKPDTEEWATHLLTDESWAQWRRENPGQLEQYYAIVAK
jgi:hypothetical protein